MYACVCVEKGREDRWLVVVLLHPPCGYDTSDTCACLEICVCGEREREREREKRAGCCLFPHPTCGYDTSGTCVCVRISNMCHEC